MSRMPTTYVPPLGTPLYWGDERSGVLVSAVKAYLEGSASMLEVALVRSYLEYWVNAPCWQGERELRELRASVRDLDSAMEINEWIFKALEIGMDPL